MSHPAFFDQVPAIRLFDPLAAFLGACDDGVLRYTFADAVKLAGHSCPTVASAYGMTRRALAALYGEALPERGGIRVELREDMAEGVAGVVAQVIGLLTGAAGSGGFKGLGGRFGRRELLAFQARVPLQVRFTRLDNGRAVDAATDLGAIPADPELFPLMQRCLAGDADAGQMKRFGALWQQRVRSLLLDHGDDASVFLLQPAA